MMHVSSVLDCQGLDLPGLAVGDPPPPNKACSGTRCRSLRAVVRCLSKTTTTINHGRGPGVLLRRRGRRMYTTLGQRKRRTRNPAGRNYPLPPPTTSNQFFNFFFVDFVGVALRLRDHLRLTALTYSGEKRRRGEGQWCWTGPRSPPPTNPRFLRTYIVCTEYFLHAVSTCTRIACTLWCILFQCTAADGREPSSRPFHRQGDLQSDPWKPPPPNVTLFCSRPFLFPFPPGCMYFLHTERWVYSVRRRAGHKMPPPSCRPETSSPGKRKGRFDGGYFILGRRCVWV